MEEAAGLSGDRLLNEWMNEGEPCRGEVVTQPRMKPAHHVYRLSLCTSWVDLLDAGLVFGEMSVFLLVCITGELTL